MCIRDRDHPEALDPAVADGGQGRPAGQPGPRRQEGVTRFGEEPPVVRGEQAEGQRGRVHDVGPGPAVVVPLGDALVADVVPGRAESGLSVVVLLVDDPVKADEPPAEALHPGAPQPDPVALAAEGGTGDVEADEAEAVAIPHGGDAGHRFAVEPSDEEALRVGDGEREPVRIPRVPALLVGPGAHQVHVGGARAGDLESRHAGVVPDADGVRSGA